jgi:hypothetical protein
MRNLPNIPNIKLKNRPKFIIQLKSRPKFPPSLGIMNPISRSLQVQNGERKERIIKSGNYYDSKYGTFTETHPYVDFHDAIEEEGGVGTYKLEIMLNKVITIKNTDICVPYWKIHLVQRKKGSHPK